MFRISNDVVFFLENTSLRTTVLREIWIRSREDDRVYTQKHMALSSKGVVITVPVLVLSVSVAAIFFFFLLSSLSSCSCPAPPASTSVGSNVGIGGGAADGGSGSRRFEARISTSVEDVEWVKDQIKANGLRMQDNVLRKGINPRTRQQQLQDLIAYYFSLACSLVSSNLRVFSYIFLSVLAGTREKENNILNL